MSYFSSAKSISEIKLPAFNAADPEEWFDQAEEEFKNSEIGMARGDVPSKIKYNSVLLAMNHNDMNEIRDIILGPTISYEEFKQKVIKRFGESEFVKITRLFNQEQMGNRKPSEFLKRLKRLAGVSASDEMVRIIWLTRLPKSIQTRLLTIEGDLDYLGLYADVLLENVPLRSHDLPEVVATPATSLAPTNEKKQCMMTYLMEEIRAMKIELKEIKETMEQQKSDTSRGFKKWYSRASGQCWYHWHFTTRAKKCVKPCTFVNKRL